MLILLLFGCSSYYATGGGDLELRLNEGLGVETYLIPGQLDGLAEHGTPYGRDSPECVVPDTAWLFQEGISPRSLQACGEPVDLVVWIDADVPHDVELTGEEAGVQLRMVLPNGDIALSQDAPELTLYLEDRSTGWLRHLAIPVWEGREDGGRRGEDYRDVDVELDWHFGEWTRTLIRRDYDGIY